MKYHENFYINRLVKEWLSHEMIIIACDLDDTLFPYNPESEEVCQTTRAILKDCVTEGAYIVINTARSKDKHESSLQQCLEIGIKAHCVNTTPDHLGIPYGKDGKVYANIFLDDRSGLEQSLYYLRRAFELVKENRNQQKINDQV